MSSLHLVARPLAAASAVVCLLSTLAVACSAGTATRFSVDPTQDDADAGAGRSNADGSAPTSKAPATAESACADYTKARCEKEKSCNAFVFEGRWATEAACEQALSTGCADRFTAEGATWQPDDLAQCASAMDSASCDDLLLGVLPSACQPSPGTLAESASCAYDDQCETRFCRMGQTGACGSCEKLGEKGASCSQQADCGPGLGCVSYTCRAPARVGESCGGSTSCMFGLVCKDGTCAKGAAEGSPCGGGPSVPDTCDQANGVFCDAVMMSCTKVGITAIGGDCSGYDSYYSSLPTVCAGGGTCDGYECVPPLQEGDSCQVTGSQPCAAPAVCDLGKCVVLTAASCNK